MTLGPWNAQYASGAGAAAAITRELVVHDLEGGTAVALAHGATWYSDVMDTLAWLNGVAVGAPAGIVTPVVACPPVIGFRAYLNRNAGVSPGCGLVLFREFNDAGPDVWQTAGYITDSSLVGASGIVQHTSWTHYISQRYLEIAVSNLSNAPGALTVQVMGRTWGHY